MSRAQEYFEKGLSYNEVYQKGRADEKNRIINKAYNFCKSCPSKKQLSMLELQSSRFNKTLKGRVQALVERLRKEVE